MKLIDTVTLSKKLPYAIRHKESGKYLQTTSGKMYWIGTGSAKNAFNNEFQGWYVADIGGYTVNHSGQEFGLESPYFDKQTKFELVELEFPTRS